MVQRIGKKRFTDDVEVAGSVVSDGLFVSDIEIDPSGATADHVLVFDGTKFAANLLTGRFEISPTEPVNPLEGDIWFDPTVGSAFIYYDDFWVEFGSSGTSPPPLDSSLSVLTDVDLTGLSDGDLLSYDDAAEEWVSLTRSNLATAIAGDSAFSSLYASPDDVLALVIALGG